MNSIEHISKCCYNIDNLNETLQRRLKQMKMYYCRVSTKEQNEARQIEAAKQLGIDERFIYLDKASGKNTEREQLKKMLACLRSGDEVIVESISRLARSTKDLLQLTEEFEKMGVTFISQKENINTSTPQGKFMLTIFGAIAELERECILERQREGISIAKEQGKYKGKPKIKVENEAEFIEECRKWRAGEQTATATMNKFNMKRNTFYRRVEEMKL